MHRGKYLLLSATALCASVLPACSSFPEEGAGLQPAGQEVTSADVGERDVWSADSRDQTSGFSQIKQELSASFVPASGGARRLLAQQYLRTIEEILGPDAAA